MGLSDRIGMLTLLSNGSSAGVSDPHKAISSQWSGWSSICIAHGSIGGCKAVFLFFPHNCHIGGKQICYNYLTEYHLNHTRTPCAHHININKD